MEDLALPRWFAGLANRLPGPSCATAALWTEGCTGVAPLCPLRYYSRHGPACKLPTAAPRVPCRMAAHYQAVGQPLLAPGGLLITEPASTPRELLKALSLSSGKRQHRPFATTPPPKKKPAAIAPYTCLNFLIRDSVGKLDSADGAVGASLQRLVAPLRLHCFAAVGSCMI